MVGNHPALSGLPLAMKHFLIKFYKEFSKNNLALYFVYIAIRNNMREPMRT